MSSHLVGLCVAILEDHFGFYVSRVGNLLLRAQLPLMLLAKQLAQAKITLREVKRSLAILDQHNLLQFQSTPRAVLYSLSSENILHLIQAPRAILAIKTLYEGAVEAIFEDILAQGRASCSDCIRRVSDKFLDDLPVDKVKEAFVRLAEAQIIIRCERLMPEEDQQQQQRQQHPLISSTSTSSSAAECPQFEPEPDPFLMPHVILDAKGGNINNNGDEAASGAAGNGTGTGTAASGSSSSRKRKRGDQQQQQRDSDAHILWRINWVRMGRFFRDEIILDAIGSSGGNELLDKPTLRAAQLLLKVGEMRSPLEAGQSTPISLQDVCRYMREHHIDHQYSRELIDEKLSIIGKDITGIVRRVGDSGGGLYIINYEKGIETLCLEHIESAIRERIGDRAVRIFRLLRSKEFLEEEQVEKEAMLSSKETKELCCALIDHSFITTRQIARANDFAPARTIFLYSVNMAQVLGSMVQFTAMVIRNVIRRRMLEREKHEQLLERQLKMEVIISSITTNPSFTEEDEQTRKEQIAEVEQAYLTAEDRRRLDRFRLAERRFWSTEIELERLHFALLQFQQIRQRSNAEQQRLQASQRGRRRRTTAAAATAAAPVLMSVKH